jgi:hypothetical protein
MVEPGDVDPALLTQAQERRALLSEAMAGYVRRLAQTWEALRVYLPGRFRELRARATGVGSHTREPGQIAHLFLGVETFLAFAEEVGALGTDERERMEADAWAALVQQAREHGEALAEETPARRFLALLADGFASRRAYLEDDAGGHPKDPASWGWEDREWVNQEGHPCSEWQHPPGAVLLGYVQDDWLLLFPEATYAYVAEAARKAGQVFPVELKTLLKRLDEAGLIQVEPGSRRRTPKIRIGQQTRRAIKLSAQALQVREDGEQGEQGEQTV